MVFTRIGREIKTFFCFWTLVTLSPFLAVSLFRKSFTFMSFLKHSNVFVLVTSLWHRFWIRLLANRYGQNLEFCRRDTIRSLMDTFRSQGIFNFVVKVQGTTFVLRLFFVLTEI